MKIQKTFFSFVLAFTFVFCAAVMYTQQNNKEDRALDEDSIAGKLISVNCGDESIFTPEEWKEILQKVENGEVLLFDTLEDEMAYNRQHK